MKRRMRCDVDEMQRDEMTNESETLNESKTINESGMSNESAMRNESEMKDERRETQMWMRWEMRVRTMNK